MVFIGSGRVLPFNLAPEFIRGFLLIIAETCPDVEA